MHKKIKRLYNVHVSQMVGDGFRVFNYFPRGSNSNLKEVSPFLMLDYNAPFEFEASVESKGVGAHPHRGFETVTIVYEGCLQHRDSTGAGGVIEKDDVQWMTAASGVMHEEFHTKEFSEKGGTLHAIQLWVNLHSKYKMSEPKYQTLLSKNIPIVELGNKKDIVRVLAGNFKGKKGAANTFSPIEMYDIRIQKNTQVSFDLPVRYNSMLLITKGRAIINQQTAEFKDFILFENDGETIQIEALEDCYIMVLSGDPILESIVSYGPFVMNTKEEIMQAYADFEAGKFGMLNE